MSAMRRESSAVSVLQVAQEIQGHRLAHDNGSYVPGSSLLQVTPRLLFRLTGILPSIPLVCWESWGWGGEVKQLSIIQLRACR